MAELQIDRNVDFGNYDLTSGSSSTVTLQGSNTFNGVQWPATAGAAGQVLQLQSTGVAAWTSSSAAYTRSIVTTATATVSPGTTVVLVNRASGSTTVTLPSVAAAGNVKYTVADMSGAASTSNVINVRAASGNTIMGQSQWQIQAAYNSITLITDGSSLWLLC